MRNSLCESTCKPQATIHSLCYCWQPGLDLSHLLACTTARIVQPIKKLRAIKSKTMEVYFQRAVQMKRESVELHIHCYGEDGQRDWERGKGGGELRVAVGGTEPRWRAPQQLHRVSSCAGEEAEVKQTTSKRARRTHEKCMKPRP